MLDVFLTFDIELSPGLHGLDGVAPDENFRRSIEGRCGRGAFGLPFILEALDRHDLPGVFFIESLCAAVVGDELLNAAIGPVRNAGHDVELHVHTEWLRFEFDPWRPYEEFGNIHQFDLLRQQAIVARARDYFRTCGGGDPVAFRAGNYGANRDTLTALGSLGIPFDSSQNLGFIDSSCRMSDLGELAHARKVGTVWEVPVSVFIDRPGHYRHAQIGASSFAEIRTALEFADASGLSTFVIVGHGFEFMNARRDAPVPVLIRRFDKLCRYLAEHRDRFRVTRFDTIDPDAWRMTPDRFYSSSSFSTALRMAEQAVVRLSR